MIPSESIALRPNRALDQCAQDRFLRMVPAIRNVACFAFRRRRRDQREELIAEVIAYCFIAFCQLVNRGKAHVAFPTVLAWHAVRRICEGREVGCRQNVKDVHSAYAQRRKGFSIQNLFQQDCRGHWEDLVVEDRHASPAEVAILKIDFQDWLGKLKRFKRKVALRLAAGDAPSEVARNVGLTKARISQVRSELRSSWDAFQGTAAAA